MEGTASTSQGDVEGQGASQQRQDVDKSHEDLSLTKNPQVLAETTTPSTKHYLDMMAPSSTLADEDQPRPGRDDLHVGDQFGREAEHTRVETEDTRRQDSLSDDVSLNLEPETRPHENAGGEERRVAFLPPPRISPVFVPPRSAYPVGPPPIGSAYGTPPMGQIGVHYPREIIRIERDYSGGELVQFYPIYPIELEGRITPTQWLDTVNGINEILISAHSLKRAAFHHILSVLTLYISSMLMDSHYDKEMSRLRTFIDQCNEQLYHSQGLNILWPRSNGFLFLEIEYY
ncbi:SubName: Full=Putative uncharacterized protein {ECO:0000313/EMBL:EGN94093.1} [Serendipita indica DSM 11827]|nr:SubName: Full=Putative uncharacterized protein {ECO:0000313/EMBL:EGN94093.1} [Serendipita indica DSM 11827]